VHLVITEKTNVTLSDNGSPGVFVSQDEVSKTSAALTIKVKVDNRHKEEQQIVLENSIYDRGGVLVKQVRSDEKMLPQGMQTFYKQITIEKPHLWQGLEDPYLYKVVTRLWVNGAVADEVVQPLGIRKIEIRAADGVYLNDIKVPMYGVCRHQDWWGLGSALENNNHDVDLAIIKEIGATTIRLAHYQQSEYFYSKCDSIGFLVWAEIPFVNRVTTQEGANAKQQLTELIRQNYNHPSIFIWGLHNEVYQPYNYTVQLTRELHDLAKTEDPRRYTVSVNGYGDIGNPANANADVQGINRYFGWYEKKVQDLEPWIIDAAKNYPGYKVMLSEYGAEANVLQQSETAGDAGDCCGPANNYNETFQARFHEVQWGYISKQRYLLASYLWNMFDFGTPENYQGGIPARNMKGLVSFDRTIKKDAFYWYKANWSKEPVLYITQRRVVDRMHAITPVTVYCNKGVPELFVNNKRVTGYQVGTTDVHYVFQNVPLRKGKNTIRAVIKAGDKTMEDVITWNYQPGKKQTEKVIKEKKEEHVGL
jgi:beta-galactosidase